MSSDNDELKSLAENNLDNIKVEYDLFGEAHKCLSVSDRIGFVPISIWQPDWSVVRTLKPIVGDAGQSRELQGKKMQLLGSKYTTSIFNPHLAQMILSAYCPPRAKIYDAFAGGGTRGFIAASMGHDYSGVEIRPEEVNRIKGQQEDLQTFFNIECADSTKHTPEPESFDFSYSCPPYYDLEVYSPYDGDMSNVETYEQFLGMLKESLTRTYEALKPDSLCIWVVGNFRDKRGELRHFNGDTARLGRDVGFILHDELIFWGAAGIAAQRAGQFVANRKSVRVHEYLLVFKKPSNDEKERRHKESERSRTRLDNNPEEVERLTQEWSKRGETEENKTKEDAIRDARQVPEGIPEWMY